MKKLLEITISVILTLMLAGITYVGVSVIMTKGFEAGYSRSMTEAIDNEFNPFVKYKLKKEYEDTMTRMEDNKFDVFNLFTTWKGN